MRLPRLIAPGWTAAVFDCDGCRRVVTEGVADLLEAATVTSQTRFRWFSITKLATAMVVLRLAEQGRLELDAPVAEALPWFLPRGPGAPITARHLLSHSSGLVNPLPASWVHAPSELLRTPGELTRETFERNRRLASRPGERACYSNLGYLVLGELVSAVAGQTFARYVSRSLLNPLGLSRTTFDGSHTAAGHERWLTLRAAAMMLVIPSSWRLLRYFRQGWAGLHPFAIEGQAYGGLVGSLDDLVLFGRALLGGGNLAGQRVLGEESVAIMRQRWAIGPDGSYGLGFKLAGDWVFHAGEAGGFRAMLQLDYGRELGVAVLANSGTAPVEAVATTLAAEQASNHDCQIVIS